MPDNGVLTIHPEGITRLPSPTRLQPDDVSSSLGDLASRYRITIVPESPSTNSALLDNPPPFDGQLHVLVAEHQTAGRGRRGRQWQSSPGSSLTFSVLWWLPPHMPVPAGLSLGAGLAVALAIEELGVAAPRLKWPNDVLVDDRKIAGILVEMLGGGNRRPGAVIGIGVNLDAPVESMTLRGLPATGLASHVAVSPEASRVLASILTRLSSVLDTYESHGFAALRNAWQQRDAFAGKSVTIRGEDSAMTGVSSGIDEDGALLVRSEGTIRRVISGEVSLRAAT